MNDPGLPIFAALGVFAAFMAIYLGLCDLIGDTAGFLIVWLALVIAGAADVLFLTGTL